MMRILTGEEIRLAILTLLKKYRAEKAILCGSYSRDEADGRSDIDIPIIGGKHFNPTNVFCIANELYCSLGKAVDVYDISEINEDTELYITIFSEGIEIRTKKGDIRVQQSDAIEILDETHRRCQSVFPCKIQDSYLCGSYARGDFDSESDVDILLTVDILSEELSAYRNSIVAISSDLSLAYDVTVSIAVKPLEQFRRYADVLP